MKKIHLVLFVFLAALITTSCGKFSDGTSIWQEGLWIAPTLPFLGSLWFLYVAYRASKSGSRWWGKNKDGVPELKESDENIPIYKTGQFVFSMALLLVTIIIIWVVNSEK